MFTAAEKTDDDSPHYEISLINEDEADWVRLRFLPLPKVNNTVHCTYRCAWGGDQGGYLRPGGIFAARGGVFKGR